MEQDVSKADIEMADLESKPVVTAYSLRYVEIEKCSDSCKFKTKDQPNCHFLTASNALSVLVITLIVK